MKKHPVDDLFKRRLTDLDKKPSDKAWLKIQQNTQTRRRGGWIWYAAASVAITLVAGYVVWQNTREDRFSKSGKLETVAVLPAKSNVAEKPEKGMSDSNAVMLAIDEGKVLKSRPSNSPIKNQKVSEVNALDKQRIVEAENEIEIAVTNKPVDQISSVKSVEVLELPKVESIRPGNESLASTRTVQNVAEPAITIVVEVESIDNEVAEKPKASKLSRVFRQLKNARAGERVDWDEVGFNPKSMVARVDDRLRNKEDRGHEKDQSVKQRINYN
ncbi:hypothetical protein [Dyadobacter sp. CY323]|uniref:hypothetical protein n=1 Tax=Dyadobacter sp. CY323 TaxID=2907302 RepID=UPI001F1B2D87|nr:hypothetical protein [Dyadobacter sp. CY323]MCE6988767.1 hypothetical protein [Dyadobacter sp. CY323]